MPGTTRPTVTRTHQDPEEEDEPESPCVSYQVALRAVP